MKLWIVGLGPGDPDGITARAASVLEQAEVIAGYSGYLAPLRARYPHKAWIESGMTREVARCRAALTAAAEGKTVALVCSGDAGVYGMAGLVCELAPDFPGVAIEVVPGVTAALSGAALLGAPVGHDFAVISLSDLLTPWELIERRLEAAASGDFCICLYNPASRRRTDTLERACRVLLRHQSPETLCGLVRQIGREGQSVRMLTLGELADTPADMFTTVFIGSTQTRAIGGRMVTPRGYRHEGDA